VLDTHHDGSEMGFDRQTSRFEVMVQQARDLVHFNPASHEHMTQPFSFDISLASPLNFIAARCREPELRRQAIAMLKASKKSSWNSEHCAVAAQSLLEHEEAGLHIVKTCSDIPSEKRVRRITTEVCFEESAIRVTYVKYVLRIHLSHKLRIRKPCSDTFRYPYTKSTPMNVVVLPLKQLHDVVNTAGLTELDPIIPNGAWETSNSGHLSPLNSRFAAGGQ
jgi:hypothetical protein